MRLLKLKLPKLSQRNGALLVLLVTLIVASLWYFLGISPLRDQIFSLQLQVDTLTQQRDTGLRVRAGLPQVQGEVAQLEAQRAAFFQRLPTQEQLATLLNSLVAEAARARIRISSFNRTPASQATESENVRSVNLAMEVEGPFPEIFAYLQRLEGMQRFSTLSNLILGQSTDLTNPNGVNGQVTASFTLTFFVLDNTPSPATTDKTEEKKP